MNLILGGLLAYLIGAIPTGYLLARITKKVDIRQHGSGNIGATNVLRTVGKSAAIFTLFFDILKGYFAVKFLPALAHCQGHVFILGLIVIAGHNWPVFLKFKGGKGVATSAGVLLAICPKLLLIGLAVWVLVFILTKIVSISSIISAAAIPAAALLFQYPSGVGVLTSALAALTILRHSANIKRLLKGEEKRVSVKS